MSYQTWPDYRRCQLHAALILLLGLAVYGGIFHAPFYYDDYPCIVQNPIVHHFSAVFDLANYQQYGISEDIRNNMITRLVTYATFALNYRLSGLAEPSYHLINLVIHLANALLVYVLVRQLRSLLRHQLTPSADNDRTCREDGHLALVTALFFVVHPVHTNAVTYIVQRFSSLCAFFYLLSLVAYLKAGVPAQGRRCQFYGLSLSAAVLAMYTKESAFTLPAMIALCDFAFLSGEWRARLRRLSPFLLANLLVPLTVMLLAASSEVTGGEAGEALDLVNFNQYSRWEYFITQWRVIITYLRLMILPTGLRLDYAYPLYTSPWQASVFFSGLFLVLLMALGASAFFGLRRAFGEEPRLARLAGFGILWFFVTISVEASVIPLDDLILEYRLYLPSVGAILVVTAAVELVRRRLAQRRPKVGRILLCLTIMALGALAVTTVMRNRVWQDDVAFWEDGVRKTPTKMRPHMNLAFSYLIRGRVEEAVDQLDIAATFPGSRDHFALGHLYYQLGSYDKALAAYREAARSQPNQVFIHKALGYTYLMLGDRSAALDAFRTALSVNPGDPEALDFMSQAGGQKR